MSKNEESRFSPISLGTVKFLQSGVKLASGASTSIKRRIKGTQKWIASFPAKFSPPLVRHDCKRGRGLVL